MSTILRYFVLVLARCRNSRASVRSDTSSFTPGSPAKTNEPSIVRKVVFTPCWPQSNDLKLLLSSLTSIQSNKSLLVSWWRNDSYCGRRYFDLSAYTKLKMNFQTPYHTRCEANFHCFHLPRKCAGKKTILVAPAFKFNNIQNQNGTGFKKELDSKIPQAFVSALFTAYFLNSTTSEITRAGNENSYKKWLALTCAYICITNISHVIRGIHN